MIFNNMVKYKPNLNRDFFINILKLIPFIIKFQNYYTVNLINNYITLLKNHIYIYKILK